jgi:hypothetical protein
MPGSDEFVDDFSHDILDGNHPLLLNLRAAYDALGIECTVLFEGGMVRVHFPSDALIAPEDALDICLIPHFGGN